MNVELATKALESAQAHPERFDMASWFSGRYEGTEVTEEHAPPCGTTACFAGWVAFHHAPVGSKVVGTSVKIPGQYPVHVEHYATKALDITRDQAGTLFYLGDIEQVKTAVSYLADNPDASGETLWTEAGADELDF